MGSAVITISAALEGISSVSTLTSIGGVIFKLSVIGLPKMPDFRGIGPGADLVALQRPDI